MPVLNTKIAILFGLVGILGLTGVSGCVKQLSSEASQAVQSVTQLGKLRVGQSLPSYTGYSVGGKRMGNKPSSGRYLIHLLYHQLPTACVDQECGEIGRLVNQKGGQLYGSSDLKLAEIFGILPPTNPNQGVEQYNVYSVLVVSNPQGKIIAIYKNANPATIPQALDNLE